MLYDTESLKRDFSMEEVASIFDIPMNHSGKYTFIRCPVHLKMLGKHDNKLKNCQLSKDHFYCHACHGSGDIFVMVQNYKKTYEELNVSFEAVCEELVNKSDNPELYILKDTVEKNIKKEEEIKIPITDEELKLIGLNTANTPTFIPINCVDEKPQDNYGVITDGESYIICKSFYYNIKNLYQEDPKVFREMIYEKAKEKKDYIESLLKEDYFIRIVFKENSEGILKSLKKNLVLVNSIIERFSDKKEEQELLQKENKQTLYNSIFSISTKHKKDGLY